MRQCDMEKDCRRPVTHIGERGWVYCAEHAECRRGFERCRRMRAWERALIEAGKQLPSYKPGPRPTGLFSGGPMRELTPTEQAAFDAILPDAEV